MTAKPTYAALAQKVKTLEKKLARCGGDTEQRQGRRRYSRTNRDAATAPIEIDKAFSLLDLIALQDLQEIQDAFADAMDVTSIISAVDGSPITRESNVSRVCTLVRGTATGHRSCRLASRRLAQEARNADYPIYQKCSGCGFLDASAPIIVAGRHIANWLIGQIKVAPADRDTLRQYAAEIGADVDAVMAAYDQMPLISMQKFDQAIKLLWRLAREFSIRGYSNMQLVREVHNLAMAEEALRKSKNTLAQIIEGSSVATFVINRDHVITHWNRACEQLTGFPKKEMVGTRRQWKPFYLQKRPVMADLVVDGTIDSQITRYYQKTFGRLDFIDGAYYAEDFFPHLGRDGKWLFFTAAPVQDPSENRIGAITTLQDFTARKLSENALRETKERYRTLYANVPVGLFRAAPDASLLSANPAAVKMFGYDDEAELTAVPASTLYADADQRKAFLERLNANGKIEDYETRINRKDGSVCWVSISAVLTVAPDSRSACIDGMYQDLTARKLSEAENAQLQFRLRQTHKMEAIGTLAGGIAHDFNNILAAIFGYTEIALLTAEKNPALRRYLEQVLKAGQRAKDLVKQILTFSRQDEQDLRPVQIKFIIKETLNLLRASLPVTIEIQQDLKSDLAIMADPTQIHQVLMNLCTNAGRAMREKGGILTVTLDNLELESDYTDRYPGLTPGPYLKITVSDTGHGMPAHVLERIFDPFFTTQEKGGGTGLGLSVVHGIIKSHGGDISVYSEPGRGSAFNVFLPAIERRLTPEARPAEDLPGGTERILFVDDEQPLTDIGRLMLESLGYNAVSQTDSLAALALFRKQPEQFDLVITDMTMPRMTGEELALAIMQIRPETPVILCTGFSAIIDEKKATALGIRAFLLKPVLKKDLAGTIRKVLDGP